MPKKPSTSGELESSREPRVLARSRETLLEYVQLLRMAYRTNPSESLGTLIGEEEQRLAALDEKLGGRIFPRQKPLTADSNKTCLVFIDECGSHSLKAKAHEFGAFAVAAVIVREDELEELDATWKAWKAEYLGGDKVTHEPDVRRRSLSFWCSGDAAKQDEAISALDRVIPTLPFSGIACVLHRGNYIATYGTGPADESVSANPYLMMVVFLLERLCFALQREFEGARARLIFESRGPREDALVQLEVARLFMYGTTYVSDTWFRRQFLPGLEFHSKASNSTGLQLADLMARPCGEKVLDPDSSPPRWSSFRDKLCKGRETKHSVIGFKALPWDERFRHIETS